MNNKLITSLFTKQIKNITNGVQASRTFTSASKITSNHSFSKHFSTSKKYNIQNKTENKPSDKQRLRRRPVDSSSLNTSPSMKSDLKYSQIAWLEHKKYINNKRVDNFFQLRKKEASGSSMRKQIVENKFNYPHMQYEKEQQQQEQYYMYCPFTTISTNEDLENWDQFIVKCQNNILLTIDDYNNILKTMRTIKGIENVLNEMNNLVYNITYNEDTYYILINFYFNCGYISKSKALLKKYKDGLPINKGKKEKVIPNRFKTLLYKYSMTKSNTKPDLLYIYQSRNDRDILRQTLLDFLENQEYDKGMEYFQIMRQYQYENINNSKKNSKKLILLNYSDYILIMSILNDSNQMKSLINSLIETGEMVLPRNTSERMQDLFNGNFNFNDHFQQLNKYDEETRNNDVLFTTCMFMNINQIIVEEELYNDEDNDRMGKRSQNLYLNSSTLSHKNILLQNEFNTDFYDAKRLSLVIKQSMEITKKTSYSKIEQFLNKKLQELESIPQETVDYLVQSYNLMSNSSNTENNKDENDVDEHDNNEYGIKGTTMDLDFDKTKRRSMYLKQLVTNGPNFSEAYAFFDRMREKSVACKDFDYSAMFVHTLHTSKEMFEFIDMMDEDYNENCYTKGSSSKGRIDNTMDEVMYKVLASQLVLEQGPVLARKTMSSFLNGRHNYKNDSELQYYVSEIIEPIFRRTSVRTSQLRTNLLREMKRNGKRKSLEWFMKEICHENQVADIYQYWYLLNETAVTSTNQGEMLNYMKSNNIALDDVCVRGIVNQLILEGHYDVAEHLIIENNMPIEKLMHILRQLNGIVLKRSRGDLELLKSKDSYGIKRKLYDLLVEMTTRKGEEKIQEDEVDTTIDTMSSINIDDNHNIEDVDNEMEGHESQQHSCGEDDTILMLASKRNKFIFPSSCSPFLFTEEQQISLLNEIEDAKKETFVADSKWSVKRDRRFNMLVKDKKQRAAMKLINVMAKNNVTNVTHIQSRVKARKIFKELIVQNRNKRIEKKIKTNRFEQFDAISF